MKRDNLFVIHPPPSLFSPPLVAQWSRIRLPMQETQVQFLGQKIPWRKWLPTPVFLPGKSHGQKNLVGCNLWGHKRIRHSWALMHMVHSISWYISISNRYISHIFIFKTLFFGTSLLVQCLRICLPVQGMWVWSLVGKLRSYMLQSS